MQAPEKKISRLFSILGTLSPHSQVTVHDLSEEYEVTERTIQRDIANLAKREAGRVLR